MQTQQDRTAHFKHERQTQQDNSTFKALKTDTAGQEHISSMKGRHSRTDQHISSIKERDSRTKGISGIKGRCSRITAHFKH